MQTITKQNKDMKEAILDLQTRSMHNNLIFSGIPKQTPDNPEVHCHGKPSSKGPWLIIAKFEHFNTYNGVVGASGRAVTFPPTLQMSLEFTPSWTDS